VSLKRKSKGTLELFPSHRKKKKIKKTKKLLTPRPIPSPRGHVPKNKKILLLAMQNNKQLWHPYLMIALHFHCSKLTLIWRSYAQF